MLDIRMLRENPERVKENIKKKFQDEKLALVDEVVAFDAELRAAIKRSDDLRNQRNVKSKEIGKLMAQGARDDAEAVKAEVKAMADEMAALDGKRETLTEEIKKRMLVIPNIIDDCVPIGKDDSENVELERFGEPVVPDFEIPYHVDIMERLSGIDLDSARKT
ncbi:MAG: serine--tRNA ligase, partial [Christensenellales bacterium]